jgi:hypothetical protein
MSRPYGILLLFMFPATTFGQNLPVQPCVSDVLDTTFQAVQDSGQRYTLAINLRNVSTETCSLGNSPGGTGVDLPGGKAIQVCYYCEKDSPRPPETRIMLAPGESVYQTRSWATSSVADGVKCESPIDMRWGYEPAENDSSFWLYSRSLLKPICSAVVTTNYTPGQFLSGRLATLPSGRGAPVIRWANDEAASYSREHIPLRVTVENPGHVLLLDENSCPRLFVRTRDATPGRVIFSRLTRVDELQGVTCRTEATGSAGRRFIVEFDASYTLKPKKNDENKGEFTLDVSSLAEVKGRYLLAFTTPTLHLSMVDGVPIKRNWGPSVHGARVSLNLDNDVFVVGSDIPLHIALEKTGSRETLSATDPYYDPPGADVEVRDLAGHPILPGEGVMWAGHGTCHSFLPGFIWPIELTLTKMGFRLSPGFYSVVAVWRPILTAHCNAFAPLNLADLVTVSSPSVTFRVAYGPPIPSSGIEKQTQ